MDSVIGSAFWFKSFITRGRSLRARGGAVAFSVAVAAALTAPAAHAADIEPATQPPNNPPPSIYSPVPSQNWSGLSVGIFGGGGIGKSGQSFVDGSFSTDDYRVKGALFGLHAGSDYQSGNWVWGLLGDIQWSTIRGSSVGAPPGFGNQTFSTNLQWLFTGSMKVGYSFDRFLPYITAGPAFGSVRIDGTIPVTGPFSRAAIWFGWGVGAGVQYAITPNLIANAEYMYVCLGESIQFSVDNAEYMSHLFRLGLNYKFDWIGIYGPSSPISSNRGKQLAAGEIYNWTGFYVGFNLGGLSGKVETSYTLGGKAPYVGLHGMGGGQSGYNWQTGNYVLGVETDLQGTAQGNDWRFVAMSGGTTAIIDTKQSVPLLFTLRGRAGYATGQWLFYATGGFAYGEVESTVTLTSPGLPTATAKFEKSRGGWVAGAGVEAPLWQRWTAKFEYLYIDFGGIKESFAASAPFTTVNVSTTVHDHSLRMGLNYAVN
jgi:outer membrane immunogenic protein